MPTPLEILKEVKADYLKHQWNSVDGRIDPDTFFKDLTIKLLEGITEKLNVIRDHEYVENELNSYVKELESQLSEIKKI